MNFVLKKSGEVLDAVITAEVNLFKDCELCDIFFEDLKEVKDFLRSIKMIYDKLDKSQQKKDIYLNFDAFDKLVYPSYQKDYVVMQDPINRFLIFKNDKQLETCAIAICDLRKKN